MPKLSLKPVYDFFESVILRNRLLKFSIPVVLDMKGCRKAESFWGKCLKISHKLHEGDKNHIKVCKKNRENLKINRCVIFHPMPTSIVRISKYACATCPCFIGVHQYLWCDQAKSVRTWKYWFWNRAKQSRKCSLVAYCFWHPFTDHIFGTNSPISMGFSAKCSGQNDAYNLNRKQETEFDRLQTDFVWSHHI